MDLLSQPLIQVWPEGLHVALESLHGASKKVAIWGHRRHVLGYLANILVISAIRAQGQLLIKGLHRAYTGSLLKGYKAVYKEFWILRYQNWWLYVYIYMYMYIYICIP